MIVLPRRALLKGLVGLVAAPAVVRYANLMPVRAWVDEPLDFLVTSYSTAKIDGQWRQYTSRVPIPARAGGELEFAFGFGPDGCWAMDKATGHRYELFRVEPGDAVDDVVSYRLPAITRTF